MWGSGTVVSFQTSAGTVTIGQDVQHPSYPTNNNYDIGLAHLTSPITTITPVKLYDLSYGIDLAIDCAIVITRQERPWAKPRRFWLIWN